VSTKDILEAAIKLRPQERFLVIEGLIKSLDEPDAKLDAIWAEEAEKRLVAYREGRLEGIPIEFVIAVAHQHRRPDYWVDERPRG
jgi:putative addiction module component (TIGR02574 family)